MNMEAKLELLACKMNDKPEMATVWATPGRRVMLSACDRLERS